MYLHWLWLVPVWFLLLAWIATPTDRLIQPVSLSFDGEHFHFVRTVPWGPIWGEWRQELSSEIGDCPSDIGKSYYQDTGLADVSYSPSASMLDCIPGEGERFVLRVRRQALLFDFIPARPSTHSWACRVGGECQRL